MPQLRNSGQRWGCTARCRNLVTIWRVLTAVDPAALDRAIGAWIAAWLPRPPQAGTVLAVDGKTLRGARTASSPAPHLMACLDHVSGVVCAQVAVDGKNNEIPMFAPLLDQIADLTGVLVTADAMHAQRRHATYLHNRSAHYLLTVKGNRPSLRSQLRALPWKQIPAGHTQVGRSHERIEKRIVKAVTVAEGLLFPHAEQAIQITRKPRRPDSRKWRTETCYAITSLPARHAQPAQLAAWIRGHWEIENQLHQAGKTLRRSTTSRPRCGFGRRVCWAWRLRLSC